MKIYNLFVVLSAVTYNDKNWFNIDNELIINLLTVINIENFRFIEPFSLNIIIYYLQNRLSGEDRITIFCIKRII